MNTQILQVIPNKTSSRDVIEVKDITTNDIFLIKDKTGKVIFIIIYNSESTHCVKGWLFLDIANANLEKSIKQTIEEIFKLWSESHDVQIIKNS